MLSGGSPDHTLSNVLDSIGTDKVAEPRPYKAELEPTLSEGRNDNRSQSPAFADGEDQKLGILERTLNNGL